MSGTRLAILTSHPIQYQAPLFRALVKAGLDLRVFFCWDFGVKETYDPGFGHTLTWDIPLLGGYDHEFLPNSSTRPGTHHYKGLVNRTACGRIAEFKPDALLVHGYNHWTEQTVIRWAARQELHLLLRGESTLRTRRPLLVRAAKRLLLPRLLKNVTALAIGTWNAEFYRHYGVPEDCIVLAPYSVDNDFFQSRSEEANREAKRLRSELNIGQEDRVVLFASKLIPRKCVLDLVRAFGKLPKRGYHLVIAGDGSQRVEAEALSDKCRTHFLGFVNQSRMPAVYCLGDVFVLPSRDEPWGLAVNEAMNLSRPIVVSDEVGAGPDLVHAENGCVVSARGVDELTQALSRILDDGERAREMGGVSLRRVSNWGIAQTVRGIDRALRRSETATIGEREV